MPVQVTYDEVHRVATLLEEFAADAKQEMSNVSLPASDRIQWVSDLLSYKLAARRLREVVLSTDIIPMQEPTKA